MTFFLTVKSTQLRLFLGDSYRAATVSSWLRWKASLNPRISAFHSPGTCEGRSCKCTADISSRVVSSSAGNRPIHSSVTARTEVLCVCSFSCTLPARNNMLLLFFYYHVCCLDIYISLQIQHGYRSSLTNTNLASQSGD